MSRDATAAIDTSRTAIDTPGAAIDTGDAMPGTLRLRRRSIWEASDAGLLLWRRDFFYFLPFFAIPFWVCAFGLRMLPEFIQPWSCIILWFLKPLFDRPALHIIGVRFFEPLSGPGRLFRGLGKAVLRGLPGDLLWRRFSPWRAVMMPVRVLEGLKPARVRQRKQSLSGGGIDFCVLLTIWGLILEGILLAGEIFFLFAVIELMQENYITSVSEFFSEKSLFFFTAYCINYMLIESLYVCMGFGLYINSRVEVEGWDLEVLFRSFLKNSPRPARSGSGKNISTAGITVLCLFLFLLVPVHSDAETTAVEPSAVKNYAETVSAEPSTGFPADNAAHPDDPAFEALKDIFASKDFGGEKDGWGIRFRHQKERKPMPSFNAAPWVDLIKRIFAVSLRAFLALAILAVLVFSAIHVSRLKTQARNPFKKSANGKALPPHSLERSPEQLLEQARSLYTQGRMREAWAACFAAALSAWSSYRSLFFPPDATEYGCLVLVRAAAAPAASGSAPEAQAASGETLAVNAVETTAAEAAAFGDIVFNWVAFAYGGTIPPDAAFDRALAFCESLGVRHG
jgi:hypothetical protein